MIFFSLSLYLPVAIGVCICDKLFAYFLFDNVDEYEMTMWIYYIDLKKKQAYPHATFLVN